MSSGSESLNEVEELKSTIEALENEKADMVEKLSQAKQQGVKAVKDEEERKRLELAAEFERKRLEDRANDEQRLSEEIKKIEEQWRAKFREHEEQTELAIEEREMQKVAAVIEHDRRNDDLGALVEQLTSEKLQLVTSLDDTKAKHRKQMDELGASIEANAARHKQEIAVLIREHEEILGAIKKDYEAACLTRDHLKEEMSESEKRNRKRADELEAKVKELSSDLANYRKTSEKTISQQSSELESLRKEAEGLRASHTADAARLKERDSALLELTRERADDENEIGTLRDHLDRIQSSLEDERSRYEREVTELKMIIDEKTSTIRGLQSEKDVLTVDLASSEPLSQIHSHLQEQLDLARAEKDDAERKCAEMEERALRAAEELQEDRRLLANAERELEESRSELNSKVAELSAFTAAGASDKEIEELRAQVEQAKEDAENAKASAEERVKTVVADVDALRSENERLRHNVAELEGKVDSFNAERHKSVEEMVALNEKLSGASALVVTLRDQLATLAESARVKEEELEVLRRQRDSLQAQLIDSQTNINESPSQTAVADPVCLSLIDIDTPDDNEKEHEKQVADSLQMSVETEQEALNEKAALESQIVLLEESLRSKTNDFDSVCAEKVKLTDEIARLRDKLDSECSELSSLYSERDELRNVVSSKDLLLQEITAKLESAEEQNRTLLGNLKLSEEKLQSLQYEVISLADEVGVLRADRDGLAEREEELKIEADAERERYDAQIRALKTELAEKTQEVGALRTSVATLKKEDDGNKSSLQEKVRHLGGINDNLREQFLRKETILSKLQARVDELLDSEKARIDEVEELKCKLLIANGELQEKKREVEEAREKESCLLSELSDTSEKMRQLEIASNEVDGERAAIAEQILHLKEEHANEITKATDRLAEAERRASEAFSEKELIAKELLQAKEELEKSVAAASEDTSRAVAEIKRKAEVKLAKIRKQFEAEVHSAGSEVEECNSKLTQRDEEIERLKENFSKLEEKLCDAERIAWESEETANELKRSNDEALAEISRLREESEALHEELSELQNRCVQLEGSLLVESKQLTEAKEALQQLNDDYSTLKAKAERVEVIELESTALRESNIELESSVKKLEKKCVELQETAEEDLRKATAKAEVDRQRMLRDLQKEIKQLYGDLNDRTLQLDSANAALKELTESNERAAEVKVVNAGLSEASNGRTLSCDDDAEHLDYEEVQSLRERISNYEKHIEELKELHRKEVASLKQERTTEAANVPTVQPTNNNLLNGPHMTRRVSYQGTYDDNPGYAEATEAEYLRNVLYRYMNERETLGRESVTLARVIGTVVKFSREQLESVVTKEEQRTHSWYGGTVHGIISTSSHSSGR